jgi:hypothetical protein
MFKENKYEWEIQLRSWHSIIILVGSPKFELSARLLSHQLYEVNALCVKEVLGACLAV